MPNIQDLEYRAINKVDHILKSFKDLLRIKSISQKLIKKEEKSIDFNSDVFTAQKLLKQNQNAKNLYQNHMQQVLDLYNQCKQLTIWPRLFNRLNEALFQNNYKIGQDSYISQQHFEEQNLLYQIFHQLQKSNFQCLKMFHKKIFFFELEYDKQNKLQKRSSYVKIRPSDLFRKSKLQSITVSPKEAKQNLHFLQAAKLIEKHTSIIPGKQKTVDTFQYCQFSFVKNLVINVDTLIKNMLDRNKDIQVTINDYSKRYFKRHKDSTIQKKNSTKTFTQNIRNIKNNTNTNASKIQRQSSRISFSNKVTAQKASLFLYNLNLDLLLQQTDYQIKKSKYDSSVNQIIQGENSFYDNHNKKLQSKKRDGLGNISESIKKKNIKKIEIQKKIKTYIQKKELQKKNLENGFVQKTKKYIFDQKDVENKQNINKRVGISSHSQINQKKLRIHNRSINQQIKDIPIFIMVKNNINLHSFSIQQYQKHTPYINFQQFTKKYYIT